MRHSFISSLLVVFGLQILPCHHELPVGLRKALIHNFPHVNKTEAGAEP
jgi:hypothetical protein